MLSELTRATRRSSRESVKQFFVCKEHCPSPSASLGKQPRPLLLLFVGIPAVAEIFVAGLHEISGFKQLQWSDQSGILLALSKRAAVVNDFFLKKKWPSKNTKRSLLRTCTLWLLKNPRKKNKKKNIINP